MKTTRGRRGFKWFTALLSLFLALNVEAKEVAGVELQEQVSLSGVDSPLLLNGAGIRYKFFFKIYVAALYLPQKQSSAEKILQGEQANRMVMHFIYDEVPKQKLVQGWNDGFEANVNEKKLTSLRPRLEKFNALFDDLHEGDVVLLDYLPGEGTRVTLGGEQRAVIEGADFNRALLSVWLGEEPVTEDLKESLLGAED